MTIQEYINFCRASEKTLEDAINDWKKANGGKIDPKDEDALKRAGLRTKTTYVPNTGGGPVKTELSKMSIPQIFQTMVSAQEKRSYMPSIEEELLKVKDAYDLIFNEQGKLLQPREIMTKVIENAIESLELYFQQQSALLTMINEKAGMTGEYAENFREELTKANPRLLQLGIGFDDLAESAQNLVSQSGKFATINADTWTRAGAVAKAYVGTLQNLVAMYPEFEKVGLGASDAQEKIAAAGKAALGLGLQAQKATKDLSTNLSKLNEYGFKNGIEGLASMTRKATEFRMSMDEAFKIADKVMNPEGALDLAANLQVLGGAIGDFNDPLKLMYMATNNVEGLQDALIGATGGLALYNEEQGRFEITGINLRKAKAMADSLGISYQEFSKGAIAAAERSKAASELAARGLTLSDEQREFITNISQMKGGKMTIELNSEKLQNEFGAKEVALEDLTQQQLTRLTEFQNEFVKLSEEDIVRKQATDIENVKRDVSAIRAIASQQAGIFVKEQTKTMIKAATGNERLSDMTNPLAKKYISDLTGKGKELSDEINKTLNSIFNRGKENQKTSGAATPTTPGTSTETTTTTTKKTSPGTTTSTGSDIGNIVFSFNNEAITNLTSLNTKQDGLVTNTLNIAQNTANTSNNILSLNNQLLNFLNTNLSQNKTTNTTDQTANTLASNLTDAYNQFANKQDALINKNSDIALNTFNTTKALEIINNQFNVISKLGQPKINVESEVSDKNLVTKDNLVSFASSIKPMNIGEKVIEKGKPIETAEKKVTESTHTVKVLLTANDGSVDKVSRAVNEMLLSSPEIGGKLVDNLSYLSNSYV